MARPEATERPVAAGGWRRAVIGVAVGALAGALVAMLLPREEGPRRTVTARTRPRPGTGRE